MTDLPSLRVVGTRSPGPGYEEGGFPLGGPGGGPAHTHLPALAVPETPGIPGLVATSLQSLARRHPSVSSPPFPYEDTGRWNQEPPDPGRSDPEILNQLTPAKPRFPSEATSRATGPGRGHTLGVTVHQPSQDPGHAWYDGRTGSPAGPSGGLRPRLEGWPSRPQEPRGQAELMSEQGPPASLLT